MHLFVFGEIYFCLPFAPQRRLVKLMEDLSVQSDGTVRDGRGRVVQCVYNGDGLDATYLETVDGHVVPVHLLRAAVRFPGPTPIAAVEGAVRALAESVLLPQVAADVMATYPAGALRVDSKAFLRECERRMHRALVQPGTMVGPLAATSIGCPTTQGRRF